MIRTTALATAATAVWVVCVWAVASLGQAVWASNLSRGDAVWVCVYLAIVLIGALVMCIRAALAADDYLDYRQVRREYLAHWKKLGE